MKLFSTYKNIAITLLTLFVCVVVCGLHAAPVKLFKGGAAGDIDAAADRYEYIGDNIVATGHVVIRMQDLQLTADKAIINSSSEDLEMVGNVTFAVQQSAKMTVPVEEYEKLIRNPLQNVRMLRYVMSPSGVQQIEIEVKTTLSAMKAERLAGNMRTGALQFKNFNMQTGMLFCKGKYAERLYDGKITVYDAKFSTCEYLRDEHDHYAVFAKKAVISPKETKRGIFNYSSDQGEHNVWAFNNFVQIYGIPLLWIPVLHKPQDFSAFGTMLEIGNSSDWGFYIRASKQFHLLDEPYLSSNLMLDFYSERGFGYGTALDFRTPESSTELMFYGLRDWDKYKYWEDDDHKWAPNNSRLKIPNYRYEFRISNLTHLLPNVDFRGQIDVISDYNFLNDFFNERYKKVLEPPSYAALDYQHERFTATLYAPFRVNSWATAVERLPEFRLDFQRQELFAGLYYQGETSFDYLRMKWRDYDRPRSNPRWGNLEDYETARFDTLHMFYYPFKLFDINIIPRAGLRLTAYSETSENDITDQDLTAMFLADMVDGQPTVTVKNYDKKGGSKVRFTGEIGVEANTKFYRSWQNVKNAYLNLDGLRHVITPYLNYTYIPDPNLSRDNIYYFDEIDRIAEQNVIRLGLVNRLQTRQNDQITEIFYLENYWDYYFHKEKGYNSFGDLGTILRIRPCDKIEFVSELLLDMGQNNDHDTDVMRGKRNAGRPGFSWKYFNRWYNKLSYKIAPDWKISASYEYSDDYIQRTPYSMGTSYSAVTAAGMFINYFERSQQAKAELEFPLIFDKHLKGAFMISYNIDDALLSDMCLTLKRRFHCVDLVLALGRTVERDDGDKEKKHYISFSVAFTAMPGFGIGHKIEE